MTMAQNTSLFNLNDTKIPDHYSSPNRACFSSYNSTAKSLMTLTNSPEPLECMTLTPVNIKNLTSPYKPESTQDSSLQNDSDTVYRENFNVISKQLQKLLNDLNIVYKEIGYSNNEISLKEKLIFNNLSDSITGFFDQANQEKNKLLMENEICEQVLQRILQVIKDPKGTQTIPDLYIRNILIQKDQQVPSTPRKHTSLLNKKKILANAKDFIIEAYAPKLLKYLKSCIQLKTLISLVDNFQPNVQEFDANQTLAIVPPLDTSKFYKNFITSHINDTEAISQFVIKNRNTLLHSLNFNDVTEATVSRVNRLASIYDNEYRGRLDKLKEISKTTVLLLDNLGVDMENDLDEDIKLRLKTYCCESIENYNSDTSYSTILQLEKVLSDYQLINQNRETEKRHLHEKCSFLWEKLKIPSTHIDKFVAENAGLSLKVLKEYSKELERLEVMKKKLIKSLIEDSWSKISELWHTMHYSEAERVQFTEHYNNLREQSTTVEDDEKLLEICESMISQLERKYALYEPILKLVDEFKSLQKDKVELERSSKDSSRLLSRHSHKILLQEERARKRISRHFPSVIQELKSKLMDFEREFNKDFIVDGSRFLDVILEQEEEIVSKYPRIRINKGFRIAQTNPKARKSLKRPTTEPLPPKYSVQKKPLSSHGSKKPEILSDQTPLRSTEHMQVIDPKHVTSAVEGTTDCEKRPVFNRYMQATRLSSPPKKLTRLLPPTAIVKGSPTRIPKLSREPSSMIMQSPVFKTKGSGSITRPTKLMQISPNKLNCTSLARMKGTKSNIPTILKNAKFGLSRTGSNLEDNNKENENYSVLESPVKIINKDSTYSTLQNSPFKEPEDSIYKITLSPEGKCQLNVEENLRVGMDEEGEDTSMMDDNNFADWKKEQLAKMNNDVGDNQEMPPSINWETDVF